MPQVAGEGRAAGRTISRPVDADQRLARGGASIADGAFRRRKEHPMLDVIMLAIALGFFALSVGYAIACDRL
jgi:hypothetical protein